MKKCKKHIKLMPAWKVGLLLLGGIAVLIVGLSLRSNQSESANFTNETTIESVVTQVDTG